MLGLLTSKIGRMLSGLLAGMGILVGVYFYGKQTQKQKQKVKDLEGYKDTREKIDEVEINTDRDAALDRLRDNNQLR
jgi:hypothetical protein